MIVYVIQEIGDKENSPDSLNVMVNYHYHVEKRVISQELPSMLGGRVVVFTLHEDSIMLAVAFV